ncbi:prolyl oligopeptidase family serine peptidase [Staphylococcus sp. SQ8-PEA]|uniref:Prolyl oligopeptidase family serine peptidase n=1 Tax=Staphylococcus marylandisciuri TaxID=2981529 RepID=A0ABT2QS52_9STAP|nr:prolyl oligopeptidase family serine peptidase [Staphylococcus marylandisciuri]MCU5746823.1 prolyl oligopeptidase family serine peptidase [Staphylococcus marylandisciuri]
MDFIKRKRMPAELNNHISEEVTYLVQNLAIKGLLLTPLRKIQRIVVYLRGGKGQVGRVRTARLLQFSNQTTLIFAPYYRGNNGSEGKDEFCGNDLNDVIVPIKMLAQHYPNVPIHIVGFSRGGIQGLLTFQEVPITSFIIWGGVTDLLLMYEERQDLRGMMRRMIGHPTKNLSVYHERNGLSSLSRHSPPILIVHGGKDKQVNIQQAYKLEHRLDEIGATYQTYYQPTEGHVPRPPGLTSALQKVHQWMDDIERNNI